MKTNADALISDLLGRTKANQAAVEIFRSRPFHELNFKITSGSWSVLECIEHLNFYGSFYIPEIKKQIEASPYPAEEFFKSGLLGNYFANSMLPKEDLKKIKTLKSQDPIGRELDKEVLDRFLDHQHQLMELLEKARKVSLTKTKTGISITKHLRLRLGDTLRVVIYHNQRHIKQAQNVIQALPSTAVGSPAS